MTSNESLLDGIPNPPIVTAQISALPYVPYFLIFVFTFLIHWSFLTLARRGS
jgi:hypothetical protein